MRPSIRSRCIFLMRRKRRLKRTGSFKLWRKKPNRSISIANVWYVRVQGCSCISSRTQGAEVTAGWYKGLWHTETGTGKTGETVERKGS